MAPSNYHEFNLISLLLTTCLLSRPTISFSIGHNRNPFLKKVEPFVRESAFPSYSGPPSRCINKTGRRLSLPQSYGHTCEKVSESAYATLNLSLNFIERNPIWRNGGHEPDQLGWPEPHFQNRKQNRRSFLVRAALSISLGTGTPLLGISNYIASARGLIRFPCKTPLLNTYHFMRAGSSLLEVEDVWSTNPLFLTNREAALSELGEKQVLETCRFLKSSGVNPTVVRYSLAAACIDSANIVGEQLKIGRDRLVPEFNYLDPRAIGGWDFAALNATEEAVWALDADEAGPYGKGGKPPPNEDGTPAETLSDQVVRLSNLMSVLETLYSGDTILLIFPDGTGPALLSCLIGGIPLNRVHEFNFQPGEVRNNIDYSTVSSLASRPPSPLYTDIVQRGRNELKLLRENPSIVRNIKDLKYEEERLAEEEMEKKQKAKEREFEKQRRNKKVNLQLSSNESGEAATSNSLAIVGTLTVVAGGIGIASGMPGSGNDAGNVIIDAAHVPQDNSAEISSDAVSILEECPDPANDLSDEENYSSLPPADFIDAAFTNVAGQSDPIGLDDDGGDAWLGMLSDIMNEAKATEDNDIN